MTLFSKTLILSHRYLGIAFSLLVVMWFGSGIVMMYAGGMPRLAPEARLGAPATVDFSRVQLTPPRPPKLGPAPRTPAGRRGAAVGASSVRPIASAREGTVFADTGEMLEAVSLDESQTSPGDFSEVPATRCMP